MIHRNPFGFWDDGFDTFWVATDPGAAPASEVPPALSVARPTDAIAGLSAPSPTVVTSAISPMTIKLDWDSSVAAAPAGFMTDVIAAAAWLESQFGNAVTITLAVGYGEVAGNNIGTGDLGESLAGMSRVSYADLVAAVAADTTLVDALPAVSPVGKATFWVTDAQAKALGLAAADGSAVDGSVGFGLASWFSYGDTASAGVVASGTYDFFATAVHEITEVMGRQLLTGTAENGSQNSYTLLDLLHWSGAGTRDFSGSTPGYFSVDDGLTNLGAFNTITGGDTGDWASSVTHDPFDAFASSGVLEPASANDLTEMNALGWTAVGSGGASVPAAAPTGVSASLATGFLATAQVNRGLAGGAALAGFAEIGGVPADSYGYALGGSAAALFELTTANGVATLSVGGAAIAGTSTGTLYALSVIAADTTSGGSSPAVPLNVVVGSNGDDEIQVASLSGIATSAPTFIYGLGGNDTIDGSGMSGTLYFDSGAGADSMTGGLSANVFAYGAAFDSSPSAMDIITNFNVTMDLIDLRGIGMPFASVAALAPGATGIAAGSVGWLSSGGDTLVYANTNDRTEALTGASMKLELLGDVALTAGNFLHA